MNMFTFDFISLLYNALIPCHFQLGMPWTGISYYYFYYHYTTTTTTSTIITLLLLLLFCRFFFVEIVNPVFIYNLYTKCIFLCTADQPIICFPQPLLEFDVHYTLFFINHSESIESNIFSDLPLFTREVCIIFKCMHLNQLSASKFHHVTSSY